MKSHALSSEDMAAGGEAGVLAARRLKAAAVRSRGGNPFATGVDVSERSLASELRRRCASALLQPPNELRYDAALVEQAAGDGQVLVLGRVMARRGLRNATFLQLRDRSGAIQLFVDHAETSSCCDALRDIDVADHVRA